MASPRRNSAFPALFLAAVLLAVFVLAAFSLLPRIHSYLAPSPSPVAGTWTGRAVRSFNPVNQYAMPQEGTGSWAILLHTSSASAATLTVCGPSGARSTVPVILAPPVHGTVALTAGPHPPPSPGSAQLALQLDRLNFSGTVDSDALRGILHHSSPSGFEALCAQVRNSAAQ